MSEAKTRAKEIFHTHLGMIVSKVDDLLSLDKKVIDQAKDHSKFHVEGIIEETLLFGSRDRWESWKSIKEEIEKL